MNYNNLINRIKQINSNIKFIGEFDDNNQKTGYWEQYKYSILYRGFYLNGFKEGYWEHFFYKCNSFESKLNYHKGKLNGYYEEYWGSGFIREKGNYLNGHKDGCWEYYSIKGRLSKKINYINGLPYEL